MLNDRQRDFLVSLFPGDSILLDPEQAAALGVDSSGHAALPWAAVRPQTEEQVAELLRFAQAENIPVYPRARGTSRVGGTVPVRGGIVVSLLRMNRVLDVDATDFVAQVEPGVVTGQFQALLKPQRLFYPPDPASAGYSTLGGRLISNTKSNRRKNAESICPMRLLIQIVGTGFCSSSLFVQALADPDGRLVKKKGMGWSGNTSSISSNKIRAGRFSFRNFCASR